IDAAVRIADLVETAAITCPPPYRGAAFIRLARTIVSRQPSGMVQVEDHLPSRSHHPGNARQRFEIGAAPHKSQAVPQEERAVEHAVHATDVAVIEGYGGRPGGALSGEAQRIDADVEAGHRVATRRQRTGDAADAASDVENARKLRQWQRGGDPFEVSL